MPTTLMQITCPSCDTAYGVDAATFPQEGRTVRCARCREVWIARPEAIAEFTPADSGMTAPNQQSAEADTARIESPSIADDNPPSWPSEQSQDWAQDNSVEGHETAPETSAKRPLKLKLSWLTTLKAAVSKLVPKRKDRSAAAAPFAARFSRSRVLSSVRLPAIVAALGALCAGLIIWRADVVRLLPQTAICFRAIGLPVNLRGLAFNNVRVRTETVDGANVLVIEGTIVGTTKMPVEIPRLHFSVRDEHGAEIYAWNTVLEQAVLKAGETVSFRSRLASPPAEGRDIDVRFFNRRDLARGAA